MAELTQNENACWPLPLEKEERTFAKFSLAGSLVPLLRRSCNGRILHRKGLVATERIVARELVYTDEGNRYLETGLPRHNSSAGSGKEQRLTTSANTLPSRSVSGSSGKKASSG